MARNIQQEGGEPSNASIIVSAEMSESQLAVRTLTHNHNTLNLNDKIHCTDR